MHDSAAVARWRGLGLATAILVLVAGSVGAGSAAAGPGRTNGRIAYSVGVILPDPDTEGHSQVFTIKPDGTDARQLTHLTAPQQAGDPAYSPDGRRILYVSNETGPFQLRVMSADGTGQRQLLNDPGHDAFGPRWSPDGSRIVFARCTSPFGFVECTVATVKSDGTGLRILTGGHWFDAFADWSADGRTILFASNREGFISTIWRIGPDGRGLKQLTDPDLEAFWPDDSPDGSRILFTSNFDRPISDLYTVRPNGKSVRKITDRPAGQSSDFGRYSPDGHKIVFDLNGQLATMSADGSDVAVLLDAGDLVLADWGPQP
ncbi:hypothetical protein [Kribbella sp. NPDC049584]|uniref:TolB family protein n=1 Tax=Kribbella sp. NPDC049584 TaxID=3154833 RepID=UPI0034352DA2